MTLPRAAYNVIIGGILLHLSLGTLYTWGCIQPYVTSYIRSDGQTNTLRKLTYIKYRRPFDQSSSLTYLKYSNSSVNGVMQAVVGLPVIRQG